MRGTVIDLAAPRGVPIVVLFWSPGSAHCQALLPAILAAEQLSNPPGMIIVSQGPIGLTQDVGFRAPVVFDDDRSLARTFGVDGTPAAVVLDGQSRVATHVFPGERLHGPEEAPRRDGVCSILTMLVLSIAPASARHQSATPPVT